MSRRRGFHDVASFPFTRVLEQNAPLIREELNRLLAVGTFVPWPEKDIYDQGWDVFGFHLFGRRIEGNCMQCPRTTTAIEQVPGVTTAGFSRLAPGTRLKPHVGLNDRVLRCHLGLIVPSSCELRVGNETRRWEENKCLVFDDTLEHEAWNESGNDRVVLLLDFLKDPASVPDDADMLPD